jgi:hypothetical protein
MRSRWSRWRGSEGVKVDTRRVGVDADEMETKCRKGRVRGREFVLEPAARQGVRDNIVLPFNVAYFIKVV